MLGLLPITVRVTTHLCEDKFELVVYFENLPSQKFFWLWESDNLILAIESVQKRQLTLCVSKIADKRLILPFNIPLTKIQFDEISKLELKNIKIMSSTKKRKPA